MYLLSQGFAAMADDSGEGFREALEARELESAKNSPELLAAHHAATGGKVRTRFPPEPNGYLHIGHAKSMHMNFHLAFEKLGVEKGKGETIFRYDDTNPEAESQEYIDSLREDVEWMGWTPVATTFTSDYFDKLYDYAVRLIKEGKAYVCHQTAEEISKSREIARELLKNDPEYKGPRDPNSPWRDRPIEESLKLFEDMRQGKFEENAATLRLKMDMKSANPNMWDQVAYRIKYVPHPHAGDKWVIYPTYDYTHCIIDSIEHVDYSICTLEFETRRESYYWVLEALNLYRPKVYEFARLNITYTVLSKRKLLKLVKSNRVRAWDDPRMPTIKGLRRRGYTAEILNSFCKEIGVTRNENVIQYERLQSCARNVLNETAKRCLAVLEPLKVTIVNLEGPLVFEAADFPFAPERGSHKLTLDPVVYIDSSDFRMDDTPDYFGLAPGKSAFLKYAFPVRVDEVVLDDEDKVSELKVVADRETTAPRPKGTISWVTSSTAVDAEVRVYNHLFTAECPADDTWEGELNAQSEEVKPHAKVDSSILSDGGLLPAPYTSFQFERLGYFVVDPDTTTTTAEGSSRRIVFNRIVTLKESGIKKDEGAPNRSRKEEQAKQLAEKLARQNMDPRDMFRSETDKYSKFDEEGVPTHDAAGEPLSKSGIKKLKKDWDKQKKLFDKAQGGGGKA